MRVDYQRVLEELDVAMLALSPRSGEPLFVNKKALGLLGVSRDALPTRVREVFPELATNPTQDVSGETQLDGALIGFTIYPMEEGVVWILLKDITEKKRLQRLAETMTLMQSLESVFAGLLHELGNPLNGIKTAITLLRRDLSRLDRKTIQEFLGRILDEIGRVEDLLRTMRSFNNVEEMEIERVDVGHVIEMVLRVFHPTFLMHGIDVSVRWLTENRFVEANQVAFQQVLVNLVTNAVDALAEAANPVIQIIVYEHNDRLLVEVSDNGRGIPKAALDRIFLPFYTTKARGTGLGLALVHKLLTAMGASIHANSDGRHGTMMTVALKPAGSQ